ncbi:MAG: efflux RND transporter periplasmic adaptor subunit [Clostridia bacterium]|nr:efflux RND transporter periplasmic adaptor subunit [Clostridia bacterium]
MKKWMAALFCLLLCASRALAQQPPELMEPVGVQLNAVEAYIGEISKIVVYPASVIPYVEEFFFAQEGVIDEVHVALGQMVKAGDPLVTLDTESECERTDELRREIEQLTINGSYEDELARIDLAILDAELRALEKQEPVDQSAVQLKQLDVEEKKLEMELAAGLRALSLRQLRDELEALEDEISQNVLYAPFDGRVVHMSGEWQPGSYVSAYAPLLYLADDTRLFVQSDYISSATLNAAHAVYARIGAQSYALSATPVDEKRYLAQVLSGEKLMRQFTVDNPDDQLAPGQYAAVCVESSYQADALLVPSNALYTADSGRYLYVMEDGVRVRRDVKVGVATDWYTQITEGLQEGELVYVKE